MKTTDIKVGTYYAVWDSNFGLNRAALGRDSAWLTRAKAVQLNGTVTTRQSWGGSTTQAGIVFETKDGTRIAVRARQVLGTWVAHLRAREVLAKAAAEQRQEKDDFYRATADAVRSIKRLVGVKNEHLPWELREKFERFPDGSFRSSTKIYITDLAALIDAAYDAGKASK